MKIIIIAVFLTCLFCSSVCFSKESNREVNFQSSRIDSRTVRKRLKISKTKRKSEKVSKKEQESFVCQLPPSVTALDLDKVEIIKKCASGENCPNNDETINVATVAVEPDGASLIFSYTVSGGKIIGEGSKVVWDLSGVKAGNYTITAAVNDERLSCRFCGTPKTKEVVIKECSDCKSANSNDND